MEMKKGNYFYDAVERRFSRGGFGAYSHEMVAAKAPDLMYATISIAGFMLRHGSEAFKGEIDKRNSGLIGFRQDRLRRELCVDYGKGLWSLIDTDKPARPVAKAAAPATLDA